MARLEGAVRAAQSKHDGLAAQLDSDEQRSTPSPGSFQDERDEQEQDLDSLRRELEDMRARAEGGQDRAVALEEAMAELDAATAAGTGPRRHAPRDDDLHDRVGELSRQLRQARRRTNASAQLLNVFGVIKESTTPAS